MIYDFNEDVDNFLYNPTVGSGSAQINLIGMGSGSESPLLMKNRHKQLCSGLWIRIRIHFLSGIRIHGPDYKTKGTYKFPHQASTILSTEVYGTLNF